MPIPNNELFESFLSQTKIVKEQPVGPSIPFDLDKTSLSEAKVLYISYPETELKLSSVLKRIDSELKYQKCNSNEQIALGALGIIVESRDPNISSVEHANNCLSQFHNAKLHLAFVALNKPHPGYKIKISEFSLETFNPEKIIYWANRGNAKYPIDLNEMKGCIALVQDSFEVNLINWDEQPGIKRLLKKWDINFATESIIDVYYQAVTNYHINKIPELIKDRLLILESGGLMHMDTQGILSSPFTKRIGLFAWSNSSSKKRAWALLSENRVSFMNFMPTELISNCKKWLTEELGFNQLSKKKPLDPTIRSYCRILQRAQDHSAYSGPFRPPIPGHSVH